MMADDNSGLMAEFEEFLNAKRAKEAEESQSEDYEIEIWDENGRGARVRRSHAKPFLQSLGIDLDPEPESQSEEKTVKRSAGKQATAPQAGVARKYFVKQPKK